MEGKYYKFNKNIIRNNIVHDTFDIDEILNEFRQYDQLNIHVGVHGKNKQENNFETAQTYY